MTDLKHRLVEATALILCWLIVWHDRRARLADFAAYEGPRRFRLWRARLRAELTTWSTPQSTLDRILLTAALAQ